MRILAVLCLAALLPACGYAPMTLAPAVPTSVRTLYVDVDEGERGDPEFADALERAFRRIARRDGRFRLSANPADADATLKVSLASVITRPVAFDQYDDPLDYETTTMLDANLATPSGEVMWTAREVGATRAHAAVAGAVVTSSSAFVSSERLRPEDLAAFDTVQLGEQRLWHARRALAEDLALTLYVRIMEGR